MKEEATKLDTGKRKISLIHPSLLELIIQENEDPIKNKARSALLHLATAAHADSACAFYVGIIEAVRELLSISAGNAVELTALAMEYGANKPEYGRNNWKKGMAWSRLIDAGQRHLLAIIDGEHEDRDSGNTHLAHVYGSIHMLLGNYVLNVGENDIF